LGGYEALGTVAFVTGSKVIEEAYSTIPVKISETAGSLVRPRKTGKRHKRQIGCRLGLGFAAHCVIELLNL
jgi:hypothetical protein